MKIFDYKFIILLGLTLVVYFIYREVEYLRSKINKIEKDISNINVSTNDTNKLTQPTKMISIPLTTPYPVVSEKSERDSGMSGATTVKLPPKKSQLTPLVEPLVEPVDLSPELPNNMPLIMPTIVSGLPFMDAQILINFKNELSNMELNIINDTNRQSDDLDHLPNIYTTGKMNNLIIIDEAISEHCDSVKQDTTSHLAVYSNENDSCDGKQMHTQEDAQTFNYDDKIAVQPDDDLALEKLEKYKLTEIKKIAEEKKININKKVNSVYKPKTKNELIMEIIELKNI